MDHATGVDGDDSDVILAVAGVNGPVEPAVGGKRAPARKVAEHGHAAGRRETAAARGQPVGRSDATRPVEAGREHRAVPDEEDGAGSGEKADESSSSHRQKFTARAVTSSKKRVNSKRTPERPQAEAEAAAR